MFAKTYYLHSYGCQMNLADSGILAAAMEGAGYRPVADPVEAGVIILNTCSVRERAETRAIGRLRELAGLKKNGDSCLCAVGCMAQRLGDRLINLVPELDFVLGTERLFDLPRLLASRNGSPTVDTVMGGDSDWAELAPVPDNPYTANVTITRGCDNYCAYCIVPYVRGPERHRAPAAIIDDIKRLAGRGILEVTLVGQNVNSYVYGEIRFPDLIRRVARDTDIPRIRFITSHPKDLSDDLIALLADEPKLMGHVHLPLQSGSDRILALMFRGYGYDRYRERVSGLRRARPDIAVTTDLMVGFPGETEAEYQMTLAAVREIAFDAAFMFRYSVREGTWAADHMADDVPEPVKLERLTALIGLQKEVAYQVNQREIGRTRSVLIDGVSRRDAAILKGKTEGNKTILLRGGADLRGRIVPVTVTAADSWTLHGEPAA